MFPLKPEWPRVTSRGATRSLWRGDLGCHSVPASFERPRALRRTPWHTPAHTPKLTLAGGTPTLVSHVPGTGPRRTRATETRGRRGQNGAQLRALLRRGPNKSLAFNYSAGLILMQFSGGSGRGVGRLSFFFKPKEVGLGGTGWQGAERWPRLVAGDPSPPIRLLTKPRGLCAETDGLQQGRVQACPPTLHNNNKIRADFIIFWTQRTPTAPLLAGLCDH